MVGLPLSPKFAEPASETVFIVDDDADLRQALTQLIRAERLHSEAFASARDFLDAQRATQPGCLLLDIRMPGMSGIELQRELSRLEMSPPIIFLTAAAEVPLASQVLRSGAVDYLLKPFSAEVLLERIHEALARDRENRQRSAKKQQLAERVARLTPREREIMSMLGAGIGAKGIAQRLSICAKTVDNHRIRILEKMDVENPAQLSRLLAEAEGAAPWPTTEGAR